MLVVGHFEGGGSDLTPEFATQKKMEEWITLRGGSDPHCIIFTESRYVVDAEFF